MNDLIVAKNLPLVSSFEAYKTYVQNIADLSQSEEESLFENYKRNACLASVQKIILSQLKNVVWIASKFSGYGIPQEDLVQEGNIGLMKAIKNFDLKHKVRVYTYAAVWIKSEIQAYILKNWRLVKIATTNDLKKLFFNFKSLQNKLHNLGYKNDVVLKEIAKELNVQESDVREMSAYVDSGDVLISEFDLDNENNFLFIKEENTPLTLLEDKREESSKSNFIRNALEKLTDKEQKVIQYKFLEESPLNNREIAKLMNISAERVRQIESSALLKMRNT